MPFCLLSYRTHNLGDYIQSIAASKFLPRIDYYIDRERLDEVTAPFGEPIKLILNGWFCHRPDKWPPGDIEPLLISIHITNNPEPSSGVRAREEFSRMPNVLSYLRENGPVGARDQDTLGWLRRRDIESYYSGCLTLTLDRPALARESFIVLNDVPESVATFVETTAAEREVRRVTHLDHSTTGVAARLQQARELINLYAQASCVVTTRLHGALPCLAMGTPVVLIDASWDQSRFAGVNELVHHFSVEEFVSGHAGYNVNDPPPNPSAHLRLREQLEKRVSDFVAGRT